MKRCSNNHCREIFLGVLKKKEKRGDAETKPSVGILMHFSVCVCVWLYIRPGMSAHVSICACIPGVCVCVCLSYICPGMSARVSICARIGVDTVCVCVCVV